MIRSMVVSRRRRLALPLLFGLAVLAGAPSAALAQDNKPKPSEEQMAEARKQFEAGVSLLDDPEGAKYEEAYRAFTKAYELSQSPKALGNIAFCAFHLERDGEAIDAYSSYLREVPDISERERNQIQKDLNTLTATVARIKITINHTGSSFVLVDKRTQTRGNPIENAYKVENGKEINIRVRPGRHTFIAKAGTVESLPAEMTVEPGSNSSQEINFGAPKGDGTVTPPNGDQGAKDGGRSLAGPIVLGVLGLAGIGTGIATGLIARGKTSDIEDRCPNDQCPSTYTTLVSDRTSAKTFGTIADVGFIGGGVLLGGALLWYVLQPSGGSSSNKSTTAATVKTSWLPSAMCTQVGCGATLQRGF